jgi:hypothetical protein
LLRRSYPWAKVGDLVSKCSSVLDHGFSRAAPPSDSESDLRLGLVGVGFEVGVGVLGVAVGVAVEVGLGLQVAEASVLEGGGAD